jgi:hypothetical protein
MQGGRARSSSEIMNSTDISYDAFTPSSMTSFYGAYSAYENDEAADDPFAAKERAQRKPFWTRPSRTPLPELQEWRNFVEDTPDERVSRTGFFEPRSGDFALTKATASLEKGDAVPITGDSEAALGASRKADTGPKSTFSNSETTIDIIKIGISMFNQMVLLIFIFAVAVAVSLYCGIQIGRLMKVASSPKGIMQQESDIVSVE